MLPCLPWKGLDARRGIKNPTTLVVWSVKAFADDRQVTITLGSRLKEQLKKTIGFDVEHKRQQLSPGTVTLTE